MGKCMKLGNIQTAEIGNKYCNVSLLCFYKPSLPADEFLVLGNHAQQTAFSAYLYVNSSFQR
jgi:hypothetical protein